MKFVLKAIIFGFSSAAFLSGCAELGEGSAMHWNATLQSVVPRDSIPPATDARCAASQSNAVDDQERMVAIVRLRVGRLPYDMAFSLPAGFDVQPGESVVVDSMRCKLRQVVPTEPVYPRRASHERRDVTAR